MIKKKKQQQQQKHGTHLAPCVAQSRCPVNTGIIFFPLPYIFTLEAIWKVRKSSIKTPDF